MDWVLKRKLEKGKSTFLRVRKRNSEEEENQLCPHGLFPPARSLFRKNTHTVIKYQNISKISSLPDVGTAALLAGSEVGAGAVVGWLVGGSGVSVCSELSPGCEVSGAVLSSGSLDGSGCELSGSLDCSGWELSGSLDCSALLGSGSLDSG